MTGQNKKQLNLCNFLRSVTFQISRRNFCLQNGVAYDKSAPCKHSNTMYICSTKRYAKKCLLCVKPVNSYLKITERAPTIQVSLVDFRSILSEK